MARSTLNVLLLLLILLSSTIAATYRGVPLHRFADTNSTSSRGITHLQFADDTLIFVKKDAREIKHIRAILRWFDIFSGLEVNYNKSTLVGNNVRESEGRQLAEYMGCKLEPLPFRYLGSQVGINPRLISSWKLLEDRFRKKMAGWKGKILSVGGRLTLINSVLTSLPMYNMSLFLLPKTVIESCKKMMRNFLWGGDGGCRSYAKVNWELVARPKELDGAGIYDMQLRNYAQLLKRLWGLFNGEVSTWASLVRRRYAWNSIEDFWNANPRRLSAIWRDIVTCCGRDTVPGQFFQCQIQVGDQWILKWEAQESDKFTIGSCYYGLLHRVNTSLHPSPFAKVWAADIPYRVCFFFWLAMVGGMPTKGHLLARHVIGAEQAKCSLCGLEIETRDHLLLHCRHATAVWAEVAGWLEVTLTIPATLDAMWLAWDALLPTRNKEAAKMWGSLFYAVVWTIWKSRNAKVFKQTTFDSRRVYLRSLSCWYWWIKGKVKKFPYSGAEVERTSTWLIAWGRNPEVFCGDAAP